jgi:co-chaperonin GroES (HSP10)
MKEKVKQLGLNPKPMKETVKELDLVPMPGRFFCVPIKEVFIRKKASSTLLLPNTVNDKTKMDAGEIFYDHPNQMQVVAVGPDFKYPEGGLQKQVVKLGDIVAYRTKPNGFTGLIFKGHIIFELTASDLIAILGNDQTFDKI